MSFGPTVVEKYREPGSAAGRSFRPDETIGLGTNVLEKGRGELVSSCGTHLGHNLPDLKGDRCPRVRARVRTGLARSR